MEAFKVFATMSLVDMVSGPLGRIRDSMGALGDRINGLSGRMGNFALAMAPVALAAGALLMSFGALAKEAIAFESVMADVAKVVSFETKAELQAMSDTILDMSTRIPMAADGLGAIISAAAQSGIAKNDLTEFAEMAAKMGVAFDLTGDQAGKMMADWRAGMNLTLPRVYALADAVNHLSNNMNATAPALGEVMQRVGPMAMAAGLAETQVAALGAAFLSAGAAPEVAATALKKFTSTLVMGAAMADKQAEAFRSLGFDAVQMAKDMQTDAQGTIMKVMQALADRPKELQVSLLQQMFGEQGVGAIAPLLANMGNLSQAFELVGDSALYAGSMQGEFEARAATTENALILLRNKATALAITMGNAFLPAIKIGAEFLGDIVESIRRIMASPLGQWILQVTAALAGGIVAVTAFAGGIWLLRAAGPLIGKALAPLKAILLSVSWPVYAVIAAFAAFYLAYKTNFGGFADFIDGIWKKVSLVFQGVRVVVTSMVDGVGEIRGELGQEIQAAGLLGVVTNISRLFYRVTQLFKGYWTAVSASFGRIGAIFDKIFGAIGNALGRIGQLFAPLIAMLSSGEVTSSASTWERLGGILGTVAGFVLEALATALQIVVNGLSVLLDCVGWVIALFTGDFSAACAFGESILASFGDSILALADLFGFGDWLREAWAEAMAFLDSFSLFETGAGIINGLLDGLASAFQAVSDWFKGLWDSITGFFSGSDLEEQGAGLGASLLDGLGSIASGIVNLGASLVGGLVSGIGSITSGIFDAGASLAGGLVNSIGSIATGIWSAGASIVGALADGISGTAGGALEAGASLGAGLVDGLQSAGGSISGWCSGVWGSITGFFSGSNLEEQGAGLGTSLLDGLGSIASGVFRQSTSLVGGMVDGISSIASGISDAGASLAGGLVSGIGSKATGIWNTGASIVSGLADGISVAAGGALEAGASLGAGLVDGLQSVGGSVSGWCSDIFGSITGFFSGESLAASGKAIMETLGAGVAAAKDSVIASVTSVFSSLRNLLPFSDAKEGPLSDLTASGAAIMQTLGGGVLSGQAGLVSAVSGVFGTVGDLFDKATSRLFGDEVSGPDIALRKMSIPEPGVPEAPVGFAQGQGNGRTGKNAGGGTISIHIEHLELPDVTDAGGFVAALQGMVAEYDGVSA